jgi:RNase P protein component
MMWRSLAKKTEFHRVYEEGVKRVGRLLVVYLLPADDLAHAVVASRKVGGAVQRNRAKRLLREARRLGGLARPDQVMGIRTRFFPDPDAADEAAGRAAGGLWVVLVARRAILDASMHEVRAELDELLSR